MSFFVRRPSDLLLIACARAEALTIGDFKWPIGALCVCVVGALLTRATVGLPARGRGKEWTVWINCGITHHFEGMQCVKNCRKGGETGIRDDDGNPDAIRREEEWRRSGRMQDSSFLRLSRVSAAAEGKQLGLVRLVVCAFMPLSPNASLGATDHWCQQHPLLGLGPFAPALHRP